MNGILNKASNVIYNGSPVQKCIMNGIIVWPTEDTNGLGSITVNANESYTATSFTPTVTYNPKVHGGFVPDEQKGVTWSITSGSTYASINASTGVVTINTRTWGNEITISATSTYDSSIVGTATVTINNSNKQTPSTKGADTIGTVSKTAVNAYGLFPNNSSHKVWIGPNDIQGSSVTWPSGGTKYKYRGVDVYLQTVKTDFTGVTNRGANYKRGVPICKWGGKYLISKTLSDITSKLDY